MEHCCCGNKKRDTPVKITVHPCQCKTPSSSSRSSRPNLDKLAHVSSKQYEERTRLGLPLETGFEKAANSIWS